MTQVKSNATSNCIKRASVRLLQTILIASSRRRAAKDVISRCYEQWSQSDMFRKGVVQQMVFSVLFLCRVAGIIKQYLDSNINKSCLKQLYDESKVAEKRSVALPPDWSATDASEKFGKRD